MKLSITRDDLVAGLALVGRAVASRATLPALGGVQLSADADSGLTLRATDLELSLTRTAPATVDTSGSVLLPARLLADVARSLPPGPVELAQRPDQRDV